MNFTRILGQNNKIYQKFGDYCITEVEPNQCCIVCCFCQDEHHCEDAFWTHVQEMHDYTPLQLRIMSDKPVVANGDSGAEVGGETTLNCNIGASVLSTLNNNSAQPPASSSPMYVEAEYLEGVALNDPNALLELTDITRRFFDFKDDERQHCASQRSNANEGSEMQGVAKADNEQPVPNEHSPQLNGIQKHPIEIDKLTPKQFVENGKLLKCLFQQMQRTNNELKYKLNKLTQAVRLIEIELKKQLGSRARKCYMKIIPDQPFNSRDEVLILDDELHHSKEMRDALHEEALAIAAENADVFCRVLWRFIMTDEVSNQFCWRGVVNSDKVIKYPVKDMTMLDVFQGVFREKFPEQALNFFKDRTMTYFNKAHERLKRKQLSKADSNSAESNGCDLACGKETLEEAKSDYKRPRNEAELADDDVVSVFEEVLCG